MRKYIFIFTGILLAFAVSCGSISESGNSQKKALLIIPSANVQDVELTTVQNVLTESGVIVTVASLEGKTVNGSEGGFFEPDLKLADVKVKNYDMVTCIGGGGVFILLKNKEIISLVQEFHKKGKYVTAICASCVILANAGILEGVKATCYPEPTFVNMMKDSGAEYIREKVVVSGKIITGNGPGASQPFAEALAASLTDSR